MSVLTITLPEEQRAFVEQTVSAGRFQSVDAMMSSLISEAQDRAERDRIEGLLLESLDDPAEDIPDTPEFWEGLHREVEDALAAKKSS